MGGWLTYSDKSRRQVTSRNTCFGLLGIPIPYIKSRILAVFLCKQFSPVFLLKFHIPETFTTMIRECAKGKQNHSTLTPQRRRHTHRATTSRTKGPRSNTLTRLQHRHSKIRSKYIRELDFLEEDNQTLRKHIDQLHYRYFRTIMRLKKWIESL
jgi:hypothetical protein